MGDEKVKKKSLKYLPVKAFRVDSKVQQLDDGMCKEQHRDGVGRQLIDVTTVLGHVECHEQEVDDEKERVHAGVDLPEQSGHATVVYGKEKRFVLLALLLLSCWTRNIFLRLSDGDLLWCSRRLINLPSFVRFVTMPLKELSGRLSDLSYVDDAPSCFCSGLYYLVKKF